MPDGTTTMETTGPRNVRTDDLGDVQAKLSNSLGSRGNAFGSGWLTPAQAWATYSQNGTVKQLIQRMGALMVGKGWTYKDADVDFDWSPVASDLRRKRTQSVLQSGVIWMHVFGGAGVFKNVDDADRPLGDPLDHRFVRRIRSLVPMTAYDLQPAAMDGGTFGAVNYANATHFRVRNPQSYGIPSLMAQPLVHRSRVAVIVANDAPLGLGGYGAGVLSSLTGWPPSWIEGIFDQLCSWRGAEKDASLLLRTMSLLVLQLDGFREAINDPELENSMALQKELDATAERLQSDSILTLDAQSRLVEVSRNVSGAADLLEAKKMTFVSATGQPKSLVIMDETANMSGGDGPMDMLRETIEAAQPGILDAPITEITNLELAVLEHQAFAAVGEDPLETPTQYTIDYNALRAKTDKEKAEERDLASKSRERDIKGELPPEVWTSDAQLDKDYPAMGPWRAEQQEAREAAAVAAAAARAAQSEGERRLSDLPAEAFVSSSEVARKFGVTTGTVLSWMKSGLIEGRRIGGRWKFHLPTVWEALKGGVRTAPAAEPEPATEVEQADRNDSLGLSSASRFGPVTGSSVAMREVFSVLERVAPSQLSVLVLGETGTGKEGIARGLHENSGRESGPFVAINCGTLSADASVASCELLGRASKAGPFEMANGGTLFLDEVGELSIAAQAVLLRALAGDVCRVGGKSVEVDVRVVSATWRPVDEMRYQVDPHTRSPVFRPDLYERLAQVVVEAPPLRDREVDIMMLARMFYAQAVEGMGGQAHLQPFTAQAERVMMAHPWPGNVRELKSAVERAVVLGGTVAPIEPDMLMLHTRGRV